MKAGGNFIGSRLEPLKCSVRLPSPRIDDELGLIFEAFQSNRDAPLGPHVYVFWRETTEQVGVRHPRAQH